MMYSLLFARIFQREPLDQHRCQEGAIDLIMTSFFKRYGGTFRAMSARSIKDVVGHVEIA